MAPNVCEVLSVFFTDYKTNTPQRIKIIDAYLFYILLTGIIQFIYCCLVGTFPFNSFLSGFTSSVASFVLAVLTEDKSDLWKLICYGWSCLMPQVMHFQFTLYFIGMYPVYTFGDWIVIEAKLSIKSYKMCLRLQVNPQNKGQFSGINPERAFADFIFAHVILHLVVMNFIG